MNGLEYIRVNELIPYARNARKHDAAQVQQIAASIKEFGFVNPILIDSENTIIAGHGRLAAAQLLKIENVPVLRVEHLTKAQIKAYTLVDNRLAETSEWDREMLSLELEDLALNLDFDLGPIGFSDEEIAVLLMTPPIFKPDLPNDDNDDTPKKLKINVEFDSEAELEDLFNELKDRNFKVKVG